jgi:hypothetical protein
MEERALASEIKRVEDELKRVMELQEAQNKIPPPAAPPPPPPPPEPTGDPVADALAQAAAAAQAEAARAAAEAAASIDAQLLVLRRQMEEDMVALRAEVAEQLEGVTMKAAQVEALAIASRPSTAQDGKSLQYAEVEGVEEVAEAATAHALEELRAELAGKVGQEQLDRLENLIQTMVAAAAVGGSIELPPPPDMGKFQRQLDELAAQVGSSAGLDVALEALRAELERSMAKDLKDVYNELEVLKLEPKKGIGGMQAPVESKPAIDAAAKEDLDKLSEELKGLLGAKAEWAAVEAALAKKGDKDDILGKADRAYVQQMLAGLKESHDAELKKLRAEQSAANELMGNSTLGGQEQAALAAERAQEDINRLTENWERIQAELVQKVDKSSLEEQLKAIDERLKKEGRRLGGPRKPRRVLDEGEGPGDEEYEAGLLTQGVPGVPQDPFAPP